MTTLRARISLSISALSPENFGLPASTDIEVGEEITILTIAYIDIPTQRSIRQASLKARYFLDCDCKTCTSDSAGASHACPHNSTDLSRLNKNPVGLSPSVAELEAAFQAKLRAFRSWGNHDCRRIGTYVEHRKCSIHFFGFGLRQK
ncbi:hypothetical protein BT96DRAFT_914500 [Gymnopus androsaceus JB14]|uniref:SET domain-containing protein n=1 Tax=Gymnopus androsaceus JB14 TaxID=1447944 RepID=A0A6A4IBW5_9AGAR|nr:hypothetical protein BT96DRAFT_914500 [Gymnopus androsaceus JB14]